MKKRLIIILCILFLTACSPKSSKFTVVEVSGYDTNSVVTRHNDINLNVENYEKTLGFDKSVNINGDTFIGEYKRSTKAYLYNLDIDYYEYADNGVFVEFGINSNTGVVVAYSYLDFDYTAKKGDSRVLTESECKEIALEYLEQYVDPNEYSIIKSEYEKIPEYDAIYDFKFARIIDGIETSDNVYIGVSIFGDVISHLFAGTINEMDSVPTLSAEDYATIEANVATKLKNIYEPKKDEYDYTYETANKCFIKLYDGTYALEYEISVSIKPQKPSANESRETVKLLVYLE